MIKEKGIGPIHNGSQVRFYILRIRSGQESSEFCAATRPIRNLAKWRPRISNKTSSTMKSCSSTAGPTLKCRFFFLLIFTDLNRCHEFGNMLMYSSTPLIITVLCMILVNWILEVHIGIACSRLRFYILHALLSSVDCDLRRLNISLKESSSL